MEPTPRSSVSSLGNLQEEPRERPDRPPARHARPADHADDRTRADARLGDRPAHPADFRRLAARPAGLALSGAAPPRAPGLDHRRVGRVRQQPPRPLLFADQGRPEAARRPKSRSGSGCRPASTSCCRGPSHARLAHPAQPAPVAVRSAAGAKPTCARNCSSTSNARPSGCMASGMAPERRGGRRGGLFGGVEQIKEECRDARGTAAFDALVRDTRHGVRRLAARLALHRRRRADPRPRHRRQHRDLQPHQRDAVPRRRRSPIPIASSTSTRTPATGRPIDRQLVSRLSRHGGVHRHLRRHDGRERS